MKKQVVAIHGGDAYATYEEFLTGLLNKVVSLEWLTFHDWKNALAEELGDGYEVILPRMPNPQNAKYLEWKIWFEKLIPHLQDGVILIGHSLGGIFLAKYLSEETFPKKIRATFLVAAPYDMDGDRRIVEFVLPDSLEAFAKQGGKLFLYQSEDDPVVPFSELGKYQKSLPSARVKRFADRQHFNQDSFPEIVSDITALDNPAS